MYKTVYKEIKEILDGYFIDYEEGTEGDDVITFSFNIDMEGVIAISKINNNIALSFVDKSLYLGEFDTDFKKDQVLYAISSILKDKIKSCNYKGMH